MLRRPSQRQRSALFEQARPPRLVLRFALILSLSLTVASALILVVVRIHAISEAEGAAIRQASLIASTLLQREVEPRDVVSPVSGIRRRHLDALFHEHLLGTDTMAVSIIRGDGLVTYSTDHRVIGTYASGTLASDAARGSIVSTVARTGSGNASGEAKTLETYAPVGHGQDRGTVLIVQDYAQIESAARTAQLRVGAVLEGLLFVLFLVFVPLLARVTRRIKQQMDRIHGYAFYDELTGLPNRVHLFERLERALQSKTRRSRHVRG